MKSPRIRTASICLGLVLMIVAIYGRTYRYEYLNYDDTGYVLENAQIQRGLDAENIVWAFKSNVLSNWHPLMCLSLMLDMQLFGLRPGPQHVINVALHILNSILLFLLLRRMTRAEWPSAFVAALFAIHPLHIESVAWISERKDVLSTFFWFLTLAAYLWYVKRPGVLRYLPVALLFVLGLLTKPMLVTVPAFLLLLDFWPLERLAVADVSKSPAPASVPPPAKPEKGKKKKAKAPKSLPKESSPIESHVEPASERRELRIDWDRLPRLALEKAPLLLLALISSAITFVVQQEALKRLPFPIRVGNAIISYVRYVVMMFWPVDLAVMYPHPGNALSAPLALLCLILLVAACVAATRYMRRFPYAFVGWWWYVGTLVPVIGIIHVGAAALATRYTYVPLVGLFILITWGALDLASARHFPRWALPVSATAILVLLLAAANVQVAFWRDSVTLFEHNYRITGSNYMSNKFLGTALLRAERYSDALPYYEEAVSFQYNDPEIYINYGRCLADAGRFDDAFKQYKTVLDFSPDMPGAHYHYAVALAKAGRHEEAVAEYRKAELPEGEAKTDPAVYLNLAWTLAALNRSDEAVAYYEKGLRLNPENAEAHYNFGNTLAQMGKFEEAIAQYLKALDLDSSRMDAWMNLGNAYAASHQMDKAAGLFARLLEQDPKNPDALINLGNVRMEQGQPEEALACYTKAVESSPDYPGAHLMRAYALMQQGRQEEAARDYSEVLRIEPGNPQATAALAQIQGQTAPAQ